MPKAERRLGKRRPVSSTGENTTPYYAFQRFGEGGKAIFEALSDGWDKMAFNTKAVMGFTEQTYTPKEVKAWAKETHTFKLESGESVRMTTAQMMAFYCLSKREQAAGHLLGGGMRVEDIQNSGRKENVKQPDPFLLTQEDIAAINGALTKRQREVADKLQKYMNDQGGAWGNRVSMERFRIPRVHGGELLPHRDDGLQPRRERPWRERERHVPPAEYVRDEEPRLQGKQRARCTRHLRRVQQPHGGHGEV